MAILNDTHPRFKKAIIISLAAHIILFIILLVFPHLPQPSRKGMVHYVNMVHLPGGGGSGQAGGGGEPAAALEPEPEKLAETEIPERQKLSDLTIPDKLATEPQETMRYPVKKPKKESPPPTKKKASIQKPPAKSAVPKKKSTTSDSGTGSGIRFGGPGSGTGIGSEYASQVGLSNFPFTYYLQIIHGKIQSNWYPSRAATSLQDKLLTTVQFRIYRSGRVSNIEILEKSGVPAFDLIAIRAVQNSSPFAPLPPAYEEEYLIIQLIFEHSQ